MMIDLIGVTILYAWLWFYAFPRSFGEHLGVVAKALREARDDQGGGR